MHLIGAREPLSAFWTISVLGLAAAAPQLAFPVNSQVPPVAYVSQPYSFTFSSSTFVSSSPQISYTIADAPSWLDLDSTSRELSGTPDHSDVGAATFLLVASDATGLSSATVTLVVHESPDLSLDAPILPQLEQAGLASSPNSLLAHPQQPFVVSFDKNTFSGTSSDTRYYAVSVDNTPLPPWVQFNESQLSFSGTTPALVSTLAGPQAYGLRLIASNVAGFAETAVEFNIVISFHVLGFSTASQNISISPGLPFESLSFRSLLTLDGESVADDQIASVDADSTTWAKLDKSKISLSGTSDRLLDATVTISVTDVYGDVAHATVILQSAGTSNISLGTIATVNVTVGEYFSYTLAIPPFSLSARAVADLGNASSWLNFNARDWTLSGQVPLDEPIRTLNIPITFENATSTVFGAVTLIVRQSPRRTGATSTMMTRTQTLPEPTTTTSSVPAVRSDNRDTNNKHVLHIVLAVVFSVIGVCLLVILSIICLRRKQKGERGNEGMDDSPALVEQQHPSLLVQSLPLTTEQSSGINTEGRTPPGPPRIDLTWSNDSLMQSRQRLSGGLHPGPLSQHRTIQIFASNEDVAGQVRSASSLERMAESLPESAHIGELSLPPRPPLARIGKPSTTARQSRSHHSTRMSRDNGLPVLVGLPDRRSGVGHGNGILANLEEASNRMSWRNTWTTNPSIDRRTTLVIDSFPAPPGSGSNLARSPSATKKPLPALQVVSEDSNEITSFEEQRQKWHTERARDKLEGIARFSNAGSARTRMSPRPFGRGRSSLLRECHELSIPTSRSSTGDVLSQEHSWSKWSAVGPAAHAASPDESPSDSLLGDGRVLRSRPSVASSGQFESVTSSDSQWEDENLVVIETDERGRWQTDNGSQASPRLPFSPIPASVGNGSTESRQGNRVSDRRKNIDMEGGLKRSQGSQRGSFRFI